MDTLVVIGVCGATGDPPDVAMITINNAAKMASAAVHLLRSLPGARDGRDKTAARSLGITCVRVVEGCSPSTATVSSPTDARASAATLKDRRCWNEPERSSGSIAQNRGAV